MKRIISLCLALCMLFSTGIISFSANNSNIYTYTFEDITSENWSYWGALKEKNTYPVSDAYVEGKNSMFLNDTSKKYGTGIQSPKFNVTPGEVYTLLASFYVVKTNIRAYFRTVDKNGAKVMDKTITVTPSASWEEREVVITIPDEAEKAFIIICTDDSYIGGGYIDNVQVVKGQATGAGKISGIVPSSLPVIEEVIEVIEKVDDGYTDGEVIFEENFDTGSESIKGWLKHNNKNAYSVVNKNATTGSYSLYIKDSSSAQSEGVFTPAFNVAQGNTYTFFTDICNQVVGISVYLRYYDSSGVRIVQESINLRNAQWYNLRHESIAPEGAATARILFAGGTGTLGEAYIDNLRVYKGKRVERHGEYTYSAPSQTASVDASIVSISNNKLVYNTYNDKWDTLSDFSYAGFYAGEINLPDTEKLPLLKTISPSGTNDDTSLIQAAIDEVAESSETGMKVIKLKAGTYYVNETGITLKSGVILSGEGQGPNGTVIYATGKKNYMIMRAEGTDPKKITTNVHISDDYVKSGSKVITVENTSKFKVGDTIRIVHPSTKEWISAMEMTDVYSYGGVFQSWLPGNLDNITERKITEISGNKLTLDYGLFIPYDNQYAKSYIYGVDDSGYLRDIGVENLRFQSYYNGDPQDNNHAEMAIYVKRGKNIFVRNVTAKNMFKGLFGCRVASQITVQNCTNVDPVSTVVGGHRYPYFADVHSEKILFNGCYSHDGRHDYMAVKGTSGPIVFSDSISDMSNAATETHAGFATGVLYDNIYQINDKANGFIALSNRGAYGKDGLQGWTAGGCVTWNCLSNAIIANKPPLTYQNFLVGVWGIYNSSITKEIKEDFINNAINNSYRATGADAGPDSAFATKEGTPLIGDVYKEGEFSAVNPRSLYKAQLSERITGVITNAKPNAPVIVYPRPDKEVSKSENNVTISGVYQLGASKVNIYIDDTKYAATLKSSTNEFSYSKTLSEGVHKIYATQVIDGVEGNKTADRFIIVGNKGTSNPTYLQSNYSSVDLSLILNDKRLTYDEYLHFLPIEFEGNGTDTSPYIIDSAKKFNYVFRKGSTAEKDKVYLLTGFDKEPLVLSEGFRPLATAFSGKLIGGNMENGSVVEKVQKIDLGVFTTGSDDYVTVEKNARGGLINYMEGATVKNLELYGDITVTNITGYFGTLAGCISDSLVENVSNFATVSDAQFWATGGVIGRAKNSSLIINCLNYGKITLPEASTTRVNVGGIVGTLENSRVSKSYNFADVHGRDNAGGIVGLCDNGDISLCGNYGNISASTTKANTRSYAGGIIGRVNTSATPLRTSFNAGNISKATYTGGLIAQINTSQVYSVSDCFNLGTVSASVGAGLVVGINVGTLTVSDFYDLGNPELSLISGSKAVTFENCYSIGMEDSEATLSDVSKKSERFLAYLKINDKAFSDEWEYQNDFPYPILKDNPLNVDLIDFDPDKIKITPFIKSELDTNNELLISGLLQENTEVFGVTFLAVYDSAERLIAIKNVTDLVYDKFNISVENMKNAYSVKVFTWNFLSLKPLNNILHSIVTIK